MPDGRRVSGERGFAQMSFTGEAGIAFIGCGHLLYLALGFSVDGVIQLLSRVQAIL